MTRETLLLSYYCFHRHTPLKSEVPDNQTDPGVAQQLPSNRVLEVAVFEVAVFEVAVGPAGLEPATDRL
jgi:hypothetical protein